MNTTDSSATDPLLAGGGEMGALIRNKDWDKTPLGAPDTWPYNLRITLSIMLQTRFPMFLFWGPELTCFYNDAYRPSLGEHGKHPDMLGMPGRAAWPEIWTIIGPLIDQVMRGGGATWNEDLLVPIYRNGRIEDVYWTFSYSPLPDTTGKPAGVVVACTDTTEKVLLLKKTIDSNTNFYNMVEQAPVAMCVFREPNYIVEVANERMLEIFGKPAAEVLHRPIFDGLPETRDQGFEELLLSVYTTGERYAANERPVHLLRRGKMELIYLNFVYEALRETDGRISGIMAVATEVTEQVMARKKIEDAEERARLAIEASRLGIWDYNPQTKDLRFDEATVALFEHDPAVPVTLDAFWTKMHPDDREPALQKMYRALDPTIPDDYYGEYRLQLAGGGLRWIQATGRARFDDNHAPTRFSGTVQDITPRKNAEEELRLTNERFRLLADSMPQFVWTSDIRGNINYCNRALYDYAGLSHAAVEQSGWMQIVHPDDRAANDERWQHSLQTGADFHFEHRFRRHDGEYRWQLSRAIPQRDDHGHIQLWVGTSTDIHDQKSFARELEKQVRDRTSELERTNESLRKSNVELAEFSYVASHDLQEPLRKIQTFSNLILRKEHQNLSENGQEYFQRMQRTAERMQMLIDDLLTYSRTNTTDLVFEHLDLGPIMEEVKDDFKEVIQEKQAVIESTELCAANIIPFQFRQMMSNLIGNALKFSRPKVPPHIMITAEHKAGRAMNQVKLDPERQYCHVVVIDNGIGFDPQFNKRIFVLFQKLHGRQEYQGTGIGLSIVKKIVDNHHGIITASGVPEQGARFDIYIPA